MEYRTVIYNSARDGKLRRLQIFMQARKPEEVDMLLSSKAFDTPLLVIAARNGHLDIVKYLVLEKGADTSVTGTISFDIEKIEGAPAIWAAATGGYFPIVKFLVENGADINQTTLSNSSALRGASFDGHLQIVKYLVENGVDLERGNKFGHTCLMIASFRKHVDVVRYLIKAGADVNRATFKGNTSLHDAAEAGSAEIASLLLDAGSKMSPDAYGICPLLAAASTGHENVVEFFCKRPECGVVEKHRALKLLGATFVDKQNDFNKALGFWRRAIDVLYANEDAFDAEIVKQSACVAYERHQEVFTVAELEDLRFEPDAIRMQSLIIRERVLGPKHPDTIFYLRCRGAVYAEGGRFDRCLELWMHALQMQQNVLEPLCHVTKSTLHSFIDVFVYMLNEQSSRRREAVKPVVPNFTDIFQVLEHCMNEIRRGVTEDPPEPVDLRGCHLKENLQGFFEVALHLVAVTCRISDRISKEQNFELKKLLYKLVKMEPVDVSTCSSLLHLACDAKTSTIDQSTGCRFPSLDVCQLLLEVGADPNATDLEGRTPLHVVLRDKNPRVSIVKCLLKNGAHADMREKSLQAKTPLGLIKLAKMNDIPTGELLNLKCLAAASIRKLRIDYQSYIPKDLVAFVDMH